MKHANCLDKYETRKSGGFLKGKDEAKEDLKDKPDDDEDVEKEAEMKSAKKGGKVKKQVGGPVGAPARAHGGRAARKSGGTCEDSPFSSARSGTAATGRKLGKSGD